jgi:hypothetical protein
MVEWAQSALIGCHRAPKIMSSLREHRFPASGALGVQLGAPTRRLLSNNSRTRAVTDVAWEVEYKPLI